VTGSIALLFGHAPPNALSFLALASVFAANAAIVLYAWPTTDGFLIRARGSRKGEKAAHPDSGRTPPPPDGNRHRRRRVGTRCSAPQRG
jgi:hypothetical protein